VNRTPFFLRFVGLYRRRPTIRAFSVYLDHYGTLESFKKWEDDDLLIISTTKNKQKPHMKYIAFRFTDKAKAMFDFASL